MKYRNEVYDWNRLPVMFGIPTVCTILKISDVTARRLIHDGKFAATLVGKKWMVNRDSFRRYLEGGSVERKEDRA